MTTKVAKDAKPVKTEWRISDVFTHKGVTHGPGESLPKGLTQEQMDAYEEQGKIQRIGATLGIDVNVGSGQPRNAQGYLMGPDIQVLRRIRTFLPDDVMLREIAKSARTSGRSATLVEALMLATREPVK